VAISLPRICKANQPCGSSEFSKAEVALVHKHFAVYVDSRIFDDAANVGFAVPVSAGLARHGAAKRNMYSIYEGLCRIKHFIAWYSGFSQS